MSGKLPMEKQGALTRVDNVCIILTEPAKMH